MSKLADVIPLFGAGRAPAPSAAKSHEPYRFDATFEKMLVYRLASSPALWIRIGQHMDPKALGTPPATLIVETVSQLVVETGRPPRRMSMVVQALARKQAEGKITIDQREACRTLLMEGLDALDPVGMSPTDASDEDLVDQAKPVLERAWKRESARAIVGDMTTHGVESFVDILDESVTRLKAIGATVTDAEGESPITVDTLGDLTRQIRLARSPTGVPELDLLLEGGMPVGGLGLFLGGTGAGKSMTMVQAAVTNALTGKVVHVVTGELSKEKWQARVLANLFGVPIGAILREDSTRLALQERIENAATWFDTKFRLYVGRFAPDEDTPRSVFHRIEELEQQIGAAVDVLIVDYADELRADRAVSKDDKGYLSAGSVYSSLRNWAERKKRVVWTGTQATRDKKRKSLDVNDVSDSIKKARVADLVVSINPEGTPTSGYRWGIAKFRDGEGGHLTAVVPADLSCARVSPVDVDLYPEPGVEESP